MNTEISNLHESYQIVDLVKVHDGAAWTNSTIIASRLNKSHADVLRAIRNIESSPQFRLRNFVESSYLNEQGREMPSYEIARDGAMFLIMGFTGREAAVWKERFIEAFNEAERHIDNRNKSIEELSEELLTLRPYWRQIRELRTAGKTISEIDAAIPEVSRTAIGRACQRMHDLGLLDKAPLYRQRWLETLLARHRHGVPSKFS